MMRSSAPFLLAVALALSAPAMAEVQAVAQQTKAPDTAAISAVGGALMSCQSWVANKPAAGQLETLKRIAPMNWLYGYMSGKASVLKQDVLADLHPSTIGDWLDNYCLAHPQDDIQKASTILAADLIGAGSKATQPASRGGIPD